MKDPEPRSKVSGDNLRDGNGGSHKIRNAVKAVSVVSMGMKEISTGGAAAPRSKQQRSSQTKETNHLQRVWVYPFLIILETESTNGELDFW